MSETTQVLAAHDWSKGGPPPPIVARAPARAAVIDGARGDPDGDDATPAIILSAAGAVLVCSHYGVAKQAMSMTARAGHLIWPAPEGAPYVQVQVWANHAANRAREAGERAAAEGGDARAAARATAVYLIGRACTHADRAS